MYTQIVHYQKTFSKESQLLFFLLTHYSFYCDFYTDTTLLLGVQARGGWGPHMQTAWIPVPECWEAYCNRSDSYYYFFFPFLSFRKYKSYCRLNRKQQTVNSRLCVATLLDCCQLEIKNELLIRFCISCIFLLHLHKIIKNVKHNIFQTPPRQRDQSAQYFANRISLTSWSRDIKIILIIKKCYKVTTSCGLQLNGKWNLHMGLFDETWASTFPCTSEAVLQISCQSASRCSCCCKTTKCADIFFYQPTVL